MANSVNSKVFNNMFCHSANYASFGLDKNYLNKVQNNNNNLETKENDTFAKSSEYKNTAVSTSFDNAIDTITIPNQTKNQRFKALGVIGISTLAAGAATIFLTKGKLTKSTTNLLGKFINKANKKIEILKQKPNISNFEDGYLSFLQKTNRFMYRLRGAIFNMTPVKDALFKKLANEKCRLKKPCDKVTEGFRKLSFATVKSSYSTADKNMHLLTDAFSATNKRIAIGEFSKTKTPPSKNLCEDLDKSVEFINSEFESSFGLPSLNKRSEFLMKKFDGLDKKVYDTVYGKIKTFVSDVDEWTTFVSEKLVEPDKKAFMEELTQKKKVITHKPEDNYEAMHKVLMKLDDVINPKDKQSRVSIKNMRKLTEEYVNLSGEHEAKTRENIIRNLNNNIDIALKHSSEAGQTPAETKKINALLREFKEIINTDKKGAIEELLTKYKQYLPEDEYKKLKTIADTATKSLNKAVYNESFEYVDKLRDLSVGSALTDVAIGMGIPTVTTTVAMTNADTKEKKRSVALKYGLPLLAGVATSTACTIKLISGGRALLLGGAVTLIGNEIFERVDNYLLKKSKNTDKTNLSVT